MFVIQCSLFIFSFFDCSSVVRAQSAATISIQAGQPGAVISSNLFGIFFEEINSAGDGGIYAELVRNRSFEDTSNSPAFWSLVTNGTATGAMALDTSSPMSALNPQALALTMTGGTGSVGAANNGWFGIPLTSGATYNLSFYARGAAGATITATLESAGGGAAYAQSAVSGLTDNWQKFSVALVPNTTDSSARLVLRIAQPGTVYLDFVSLFPAVTFNNRANGLRPDLMNTLANLKPSFMRFPGGSWVDGQSIANAYHWKLTAGFLPDRTERTNIWGYMVSNGLGYDEYLKMCEDLGTQPLFDVNCGMDVHQNSVGTANLGPWVQEVLDAIQYANGDTNTTYGAQRAANGHPAPFNLQYLEIGNENNGSAYNDNYTVFYDAIKSNYPSLHLIANSFGTLPYSRPVEIMDEHYYASAATFVSYANKYDSYSRSGPKVFVGEYAVAYNIGPGFLATLNNALGEAAFMTGIERNSDIVALACYAPLFCNVSNQDWTPNLIYFNGTQVYGTPSYYVQQMFSQNRGDAVLPTSVSTTNTAGNSAVHGAIGVGSWSTAVQYTNITVVSNGVTLYQSDFVNQGTTGWRVYNGTWGASGGLYQQTSTSTTDCRSTTGNTNWANYTITLRARKTGGSEGFTILFNWLDDNNWTWLNIGGWGNTLTGIEQMSGGSKAILGTRISQVITANTWYDIRIVLTGSRMQCYVNNSLVQDVTYPSGLYVSSSYAKASGQVIVKAVNPYSTPMMTTINVSGVNAIAPTATVVQLTSGSPSDLNSLAAPTYVSPTTNLINNAGTNFTLTLPANSLSVLRLQASGRTTYTNLQWQVPASLNVGQTAATLLLGWQSGQSVNLTTNANYAISYASADPTIARVDASGNVSGVGYGTTSVIAAYGSLGLSVTQTVQVISVPTVLAHRYSFNETSGMTCADSIGGATWNGTLPNGGSFSGGQLSLASASSQYVQLPAGILSNYTAVTVDAWVSFGTLPSACFFYGFGNTNGAIGIDYIFCQPQNGRIAITDTNYSGEQGATGGGNWSGLSNLHITSVYNPPAGYVALYTNGVLVSQNNAETVPFTSVNAAINYIGRSLYGADSYFNFSVDEFRIYSGALNASQIAASQALGPDQLLSAASPTVGISLAGGGVTLAWPLAAAGFNLESRTNLVLGAWAPAALVPQIVNGQWQAVVPVTGNAQYFRLQQ
jgi:alpha-L-arabinofuranosidase